MAELGKEQRIQLHARMAEAYRDAMRTRWEGHTTDGVLMGFYSIGFIETNPAGAITRWETHVNDEEYGRFLLMAIGVRGPFTGEDYTEALVKHLARHGPT